MKKLLVFVSIFMLLSCGQKKYDTGSVILDSIQDTKWHIPFVPFVNLEFTQNKMSFVINEDSNIFNEVITLVGEDIDTKFVVFKVTTKDSDRIFGLQVIDDDTISFALLPPFESLESYKKTHDMLKVSMKKQIDQ